MPFWAHGWLWAGLAFLSAIPFLVSPFPMMPDYFSHVGRYHVMTAPAGDPYLPLYYYHQWMLIGNLGVDLLMRVFGPVLGTERAAHLIAALIPPFGVAGIYFLAKSTGRPMAPGALIALSLLYALPFTLGLLNFCLAQALALWVAAGWLQIAERPAWLRWAYAVPAAAIVWVAHTAGWGILLILIGCLELAAARRDRGLSLADLWSAGLRSLPFALPLLLTLIWRSGTAGSVFEAHEFSFGMKLLWVKSLFRSENQPFDQGSAVLLFAVTCLLLILMAMRRATVRPGLIWAGLIFVTLFLVLPHFLFGSYYADMRMLPIALILLLIAIVPRSPPLGAGIALAGLALFGARIAVTSAGWHERGTALARDLAVLESVPQGSRIAVMAYRSACTSWTAMGFEHAPSLAIVRRHAFVNSEFDYAGSHLMRPIYNSGRDFNAVPSNLIAGSVWPCEGRPLAAMLAALPRDRFDFVWIFEAMPPADVTWLEPVAAGPNGRLYRIRRTPS